MPNPSRSRMDAPSRSQPGAAVWRLRLLGTFELSDGARRHSKLGTRAAMALLARLCLRPNAAHPREELVELLWPGTAAEAGRQRLRQTLSTLRQVLEPAEHPGWPVLDADRIAIRLRPGTIDCDAVQFEAAFRQGEHDAARALYAGDFMPGFFDEWIGDERLRLEGLFDRLRPAAPAAAAAIAAAAPPPAAAPRRSALPAYLTRLIGAEAQAQRLRLAVQAHRLVTLLGPGGMGKTRLAVEVAQSMAQAETTPFESVTFVPLAACQTRRQMLDQLLLTLQLPPGPAGALEALAQALEGRPALLVLDNFEQVVDEGAEVVAELAARLPLLHQLVTSRRALALSGEHELQAAALAAPASTAALTDAAANPAVALFVDRARAARAEFQLHEGNRAAVIELVHLLDGMPLAIELAAARVRSLAPAEMADALRRARASAAGALDLLARPPVRGRQDTRHHSMREVIDWSWRLLAPGLRDLLARLTVFHGGFTAAAAQAVCAAGTQAEVAAQVDELLSHSLLRATTSEHDDSALRLDFYEPIREFAAGMLGAQAAAVLRRRHRAWAVRWGLAMPATPPLAALRTELPNLMAALASAVADGEPQVALDLTLALQPALDHTHLPRVGQVALQAAIAAVADSTQRSACMSLLGYDLLRSGRGKEGRRLIEAGIASAPAEQPELRARALLVAVIVAWNTSERGPQVVARLDEALALVQASSDDRLRARLAGVQAEVVADIQQDYPRAEALHRQALAVWLAVGDELAVLRTRYSLAQVAYRAGRWDDLFAQLDPLVEAARRLQAAPIVAFSLNLKGATHVSRRQWPAAVEAIGASLGSAWQALHIWNVALALWNLLIPLAHCRQAVVAQQLAGFVSHFWVQHYAAVPAPYQMDLRRTRRLACVQIGPRATAEAFEQGAQLTAAQAVALALRACEAR